MSFRKRSWQERARTLKDLRAASVAAVVDRAGKSTSIVKLQERAIGRPRQGSGDHKGLQRHAKYWKVAARAEGE